MGLFGKSPKELAARGDLAGLMKALGHKNGDRRREAADRLWLIFSSALEAARESKPTTSKGIPLESIRAHADDAARRLIELLGDPWQSVSGEAARTLRYLLDPEVGLTPNGEDLRAAAVPALIGLLDLNVREDTRAQAASTLGYFRATEAVEPLIKVLADHTAPKARRDAAFALGMIGDQRAARPLRALLDSKSMPYKQTVIGALGQLGDRSGAEAIVRTHVESVDPHVQEDAERALMRMQVPIDQVIELFVRHYHRDAGEVARKLFPTPDLDGLARAVGSQSTVEMSMGFEDPIVSTIAGTLLVSALQTQILAPLSAGDRVDPALIDRGARALLVAAGARSTTASGGALGMIKRLDRKAQPLVTALEAALPEAGASATDAVRAALRDREANAGAG